MTSCPNAGSCSSGLRIPITVGTLLSSEGQVLLSTSCRPLRASRCWGKQAEVQDMYEREHAAYEGGSYKVQAQDWLASSWQGNALQVCNPIFGNLGTCIAKASF